MIRSLFTLAAATLAFPALSATTLEFLDAPADPPTHGMVPIGNAGACEGGIRYDDGSYEGAVGFANAVPNGTYVMAFDIPANFTADAVCICWTRTNFSNGTAVDFDVVFYADDGTGPKGEPGYPGTLLGFVPSRAENVPEFNSEGMAMYSVPLPADLPQPLPSRVYVGALWEPFVNRQFYVCNDATASTPLNEAYNSIDGVEWSTTSDIRPTYRSLGVVVSGSRPPPQPVPLPIAAWLVGAGILLPILWRSWIERRTRQAKRA